MERIKNFFWKNRIAIGACVLMAAFGIGYWVFGNPGTTSIGENITVGGDLTVSGTSTFTGNVGIGTTNPSSALEVRGELRTTDSSGDNRLWGQGRPGTVRYGTDGAEAGLCANGDILIGLSAGLASWESAASQCPAGTWVCTGEDRGDFECCTARPLDICDSVTDCETGCDSFTQAECERWGWLVDAPGPPYLDLGIKYREIKSGMNLEQTCLALPVWCCSH